MSARELLEGMSYVDERFVDEAENETIRQGSAKPWLKLLPVAACLCIMLIGVISIWDLLPFNSNSSAETAGDQAMGQESAVSGADGSAETPDQEAEETPSVILRIDSLGSDGFTGTVEALVDTDIFEIGATLHVVVTEDAKSGNSVDTGSASLDGADSKQLYQVGNLVQVQFISYDEHTNTIVIDMIDLIDEPIID